MPFDRKTIRRRRTMLLMLTFTALAAVAAAYGFQWWFVGRYQVVTDNAFVTGNLIPIYADATGMVVEVLHEETEQVRKGELLIRLDGQRAAAAVAEAQAELGRAVRAVGVLFAARRQACQKVLSRAALVDKIHHDIVRYKQALPSGAVSKQVLQNAEDQRDSLEADLNEAKAEFQAAEARIGGTSRTHHPDIEIAKNKFVAASIELSRQSIHAPASGFVAKRKAQVGDRIRPGDQVMTIVPLNHLWVEANIWENRLRDVRPGQPARVTVDLYGQSQTYHGSVEGLVPGTGSVFALLPPDNATGNFIHIVQRVPVRIALQEDEISRHPLRPGLSTVVAIDVRETGTSPRSTAATTASEDYRTDIYSNDFALAAPEAERIIAVNLVPRKEDRETSCDID
jgi:membrane fusion protein (multidrug efflux system)